MNTMATILEIASNLIAAILYFVGAAICAALLWVLL